MIKETVSTVFLKHVCSKVKVGNCVFIQWISKAELLSVALRWDWNECWRREGGGQKNNNTKTHKQTLRPTKPPEIVSRQCFLKVVISDRFNENIYLNFLSVRFLNFIFNVFLVLLVLNLYKVFKTVSLDMTDNICKLILNTGTGELKDAPHYINFTCKH